MNRLLSLFPILFLASAPSVAHAASSAWADAQGTRIRLVTAGAPDGAGVVRGALEIDLRPGWKTYWRDPGASGVPPKIDIAGSNNVSAVEMDFPAPAWHDDGFSKWAGYDKPVAFPVTFTLADVKAPARIDASVFLGVCDTICIPVQAKLELVPDVGRDSSEDSRIVALAWEKLPAKAAPDFGLKWGQSQDSAKLQLEAVTPSPGKARVFVASTEGYELGLPKRQSDDSNVFSIKLVARPKDKPVGPGLPYTMVSDQGAVSGYLPYP
ncbi:protein-disulfide reductase DsbD family protein [Corticibacterium sp. UT-5YL-CI-8]|nr:protein-disulfide reductase DsbD family protein [Tianweitania sp. UT-5YL-CI-8]